LNEQCWLEVKQQLVWQEQQAMVWQWWGWGAEGGEVGWGGGGVG